MLYMLYLRSQAQPPSRAGNFGHFESFHSDSEARGSGLWAFKVQGLRPLDSGSSVLWVGLWAV